MRIPRWTTARRLVAATMFALFVLAAHGTFGWFTGTMVMTEAFGLVPFVDPLAGAEYALAHRDVTTTVLVGVLILAGFAFVVGPVFCSWVCPLGLILELNDWLRRTATRLLGRQRRLETPKRYPVGLRVGILGAVLGFALIARSPTFTALSPIRIAVETVAFGTAAAAVVLVALLVVEWFAPRLWCRALCPLGALYSVLGRLGRMRVRIHPALAGQTPCNLCTTHCSMGIPVMQKFSLAGARSVSDPTCTRCGACVDACPSGVLRMGLRDIPADAPTRRSTDAC